MELKKYYHEVLTRINQVDFSVLWPHFRKYNFALYDNEYVIFNNEIINKTAEFIGNTAIKYHNEYIAIWYLSSEIDYDILSSKIIHEMFHAFQIENNEPRFPNEFKAVINYKYTQDNLQIKFAENVILKSLIRKYNNKDFLELLRFRKYRSEYFPVEFDYESRIEVIEGSAQFIELMALKQLNNKKYLEQLNKLLMNIVDPNNLIPIRPICYDIGTVLLIVSMDNNIVLNKNIMNNSLTYSEQLIKDINHNKIQMPYNSQLDEVIHGDIKHLEKLISKNIFEAKQIIEGPYELKGFNVFQARYFQGYLYSKYFLIYNDGEEDIVLSGDFIVELKDISIIKIYQIN